MLPKILHKVWIGPKTENLSYSDKWLNYFPDHELIIWDNEKILPYINKLHKILEEIPKITFTSACDILRLLILRDHGGIYMDHDVEVFRDFRHLLIDSECFLTFQYPQTEEPGKYKTGTSMHNILTNFNDECFEVSKSLVMDGEVNRGLFINSGDYINNCFIASIPKSELIEVAINKWISNYKKSDDERYLMSDWTFGPSSITDACNFLGIILNGRTQYSKKVTVFNRKHLHPLHGSERLYDQELYSNEMIKYKDESDCYAFHHHTFTNANEYISSFSDPENFIKQKYSYYYWIKNEF